MTEQTFNNLLKNSNALFDRNTAAIYTSSNPISYLTSCIRNKKPKAKLTDLQKKLFSGKTMIQQGGMSNGFNSGY